MRQIWIVKSGRPEALVIKEAPDPEPTWAKFAFELRQTGSISPTSWGAWASIPIYKYPRLKTRVSSL
jgi:hypothetical protein